MSVWSGADLKVAAVPSRTMSRGRVRWIAALLAMVLLGILVAMLLSGGTKRVPPPKSRESKKAVPVGGGAGPTTMGGGHNKVDGSKTSTPGNEPASPDPLPKGPADLPREPDRPREPSAPPRTPTGPRGGPFGGDAEQVSGGFFVDDQGGGGGIGSGGSGTSGGPGTSSGGGATNDPDNDASSGTTTTGGPVGGGDDGAAVDCNGDQVNDAAQVAQCILADFNDNGIPDCCDEGTPCQTNVLSNGGFETGPTAICGSTCIDGPAAIADAWSLASGAAALGRSDAGCAGRTFEPPHGARAIQLGSACSTPGTLAQSIELPVRSTMRLRYRATCAAGQQPVFLRVSIGEQSLLDRIDCPGEGGTWSTLEHVVAVAPGIITVAITAEPGASASGAWIDDAFLTVDRVNCPADLNEDGLVGDLDLEILFGSWSSDGAACGCDLDANDVVDGADLGILMAAWGDCG